MHPAQPPETMQGLLEIVHRFDNLLRSLSGMDQFVFQPGGGADAADSGGDGASSSSGGDGGQSDAGDDGASSSGGNLDSSS